MKRDTILVIGLVIVLLVITATPVSAYMATLTGDGVSRGDMYGKIYEAKDTYKKSDGSQTVKTQYVVPWVSIVPGSDVNHKCYLNTGYRVRLLTPEGKNYEMLVRGDPTGESMYKTASGVLLSPNGHFFSADGKGYEFLNVYNLVYETSRRSVAWQGTWTEEFYFAVTDCYPSTPKNVEYFELVKTKTFTLVDDTGPTPGPSYIPVPSTTTPIPSPSTQKIIIGGENYVDANVQKTGATWDSVEEKCPKWRGNDWSGTGDYYLSHGGDTLTYIINSPASGNYVMWMRDWSDTNHAAGDRQVTVTIDGVTIGTFDAASSFNKGTSGYGWDKFTTVNLGAGSHTLKITKKDTTSSAAIIDDLWFSSNVNEIPQSYTPHSEALCSVTTVTTTVTPTTSVITYQPVCTQPICPSGKFVCLKTDGCPGMCGISCDNPVTPVIPPVSGCSGTGTSVYAESRTMQQGSTVKIPIMVCNANDLANMDLTVNYDTKVLKFKSAEKGGLNANSLFESNEASPGNVMISFASSNGASGSASIAILTFDVIGSNGSTSPIKITVKTASTSSGTIIPISVSQGTFTTGTPTNGSIDGGPVTSRDALAALQMAVGKIPIDMKYDVTKDGSVNSGDARAILKIAVSSQ